MSSVSIPRRLPVIAIVGRPNVGKSSLFNRITESRKAVVHPLPGMTRDRNYEIASWQGREALIVDTGGYETDADSTEIQAHMRRQTMLAVDEADAVIFLTCIDEPLHPVDDEVMDRLRKSKLPVFLGVNKCDNRQEKMAALSEFARWGVEVYPISALHGIGVAELLEAAMEACPIGEAGPQEDQGTLLAVVGRPNTGKSSLVNKILGFERSIASPVAGTTRDAIDTTFERGEGRYTIIDTAGIRRRGKIEQGAEKLSVLSAMQSLRRCEVALVMVDGAQGLHEQDAHIAGMAVDAGCGVIIVVNKWDLVTKDHRTFDAMVKVIREEWGFLKYAPVISTSAISGQRIDRLFELIDKVAINYRSQLPTSKLNDVLRASIARLSPPRHGKRYLKLKYVCQTGTCPPTITFFVNHPDLVHFSYERYLANQLRQAFELEGTPLRIEFRAKDDRHDDDDD